MNSPFDQSRYQIRFDWALDGAERLAQAEIVILVDVLGASAPELTNLAERAAATGALVLLGDLRNAGAVADMVLREQGTRGARTAVAIVAVGDAGRPAVEDQLGAGAIIDALGARGIDHTSPEAAAAGEAFRGLRGALRHLLAASGSGQQLIEAGRRDEVEAASALNADSVVERR